MFKTICLIPAKGCSTRLPRKNLLPLNGTPLVVRAIEKARCSNLFDIVCVSTEDEEVANISRCNGADVPFIRPISLSRDPATINDVILHTLTQYSNVGCEFEKVCVLLPTSPFVTISDIIQANKKFDESHCGALMSVCSTDFPPYNAWLVDEDGALQPCFPESPYKFTKGTECPGTYRSNGAILIVKADVIRKERTYRTNMLLSYVMPVERSLDIDTPLDYEFARFLASSEKPQKI